MNKREEVHAEGVCDPLSGQQAQSASSQESEDSKKGKRSPFLGAKDAFKKFVRNGPTRTSNTKDQMRATPCEVIEKVEVQTTKRSGTNTLYRTNPFRSRARQRPESEDLQPQKKPNDPGSDTKERRSRWSRGKGASPTKQILVKKPVITQESAPGENEKLKQACPVVKSNSRCKPAQNPTDLDVESVSDVLRTMGISIEGKLGEGTYAKVRSAFSNRQGKRVALKIVSRARLNSRFQRKFLPRELSILKSIKHCNIIELYQVIEKKDTIIMVMELARHGDLLEYIQKKKALPNNEARTIFTHILNAVEYLHFHGFFHRDLKCENILLDWAPTGIVAKLTDFGFARDWCEAYRLCRTYCGSAAYASPEILQGIPYDPHGTDIWSIGVILFIMVSVLYYILAIIE